MATKKNIGQRVQPDKPTKQVLTATAKPPRHVPNKGDSRGIIVDTSRQ